MILVGERPARLRSEEPEMASDENKMGEEVKEKKDARPCGRLAKVILTGF